MKRLRLIFLCLSIGFVNSVLSAGAFDARFEAIKHQASPEQLYRFLYALPKGGDLHNHAAGAIIFEWLYDAACDPARNGGDTFYTRIRFKSEPDAIAPAARFATIRQSTYDTLTSAAQSEYVRLDALTAAEKSEWCAAFRLDAPGEGRKEFFQVIWSRFGDLLRSPDLRLEMLAQNIKAFAAEGLIYWEPQFGIGGMVTTDGHELTDEEGVALLEKRLAQPDIQATGMESRFLLTVLRFAPDAEDELRELYAFADAHRDRWVGLNMAGIEENGKGYPLRFLNAFREMRRRYPTLPLSIHAGEMDGPDHNVRDTLLLGASRIGHGVNLIKDPETLLLLQQSRRVLIEINLISNQLLEYTPDLASHPFPEYLRTGVPVCLNTDDRGMWDSNMTDEYYTAVTAFNLSWSELVTLGRNSLQYSFVDAATKQRLIARYDERVAAFEKTYGSASTEDSLAQLQQIRPVTYGYAKRKWGFDFSR